MTDMTLETPPNGLIGVSLAETLERVSDQLALILALDDSHFRDLSMKRGIDSMCSGIISALQHEIELTETRY